MDRNRNNSYNHQQDTYYDEPDELDYITHQQPNQSQSFDHSEIIPLTEIGNSLVFKCYKDPRWCTSVTNPVKHRT